eukprot:m.165990 g.165990  ORF g.165990 m.165990 type:complete len:103 (+) comp14438_c1_seq7:3485-3793(+)
MIPHSATEIIGFMCDTQILCSWLQQFNFSLVRRLVRLCRRAVAASRMILGHHTDKITTVWVFFSPINALSFVARRCTAPCAALTQTKAQFDLCETNLPCHPP